MKAAVYTDVGQPVVVDDDVQVKDPGFGEVRIAIQAAGLCHSDISAINGTYNMPKPMVMGHEGAGYVAAVGDGVKTVKEGDPVVISTLGNCGYCPECDTGRPTMCHKAPLPSRPFTFRGEPAFNFANASTFSESTVVPASSAVAVPKELPMAQAALIGCGIITGVGAVLNTANVQAGQTMVVVGAGGIGLNIIQGGVLAGASKIIAVDLLPQKLEWAKKLGATHIIDGNDGDAIEKVKELTGGRGVDHAFEAVGVIPAIEQAFAMLAPGSTLTIVGVPKVGAKAEFTVTDFRLDRKVQGCRYGTARPQFDFPMLAELYLDGRLNIDDLITRHYPLDQINTAIEDLEKGELARGVFDIAS